MTATHSNIISGFAAQNVLFVLYFFFHQRKPMRGATALPYEKEVTSVHPGTVITPLILGHFYKYNSFPTHKT